MIGKYERSYYGYNADQCQKPTYLFTEFSHDIFNPFSINYIQWLNLTVDPNNTSNIHTNSDPDHELIGFNMYYFIICFSYSLFRLIIDVAVIIYAFKATHEVSRKKNFFSIGERNTDPIFHRNQIENRATIYVSENNNKAEKGLEFEKKFFIWIVRIYVVCEFFNSFHNFIVWRGTQYYTSAQDDYYELKMIPRIFNCMYNPDTYDLSANVGNIYRSVYLITMYIIWVIFEFFGVIPIYISVLVLSRINRNWKIGWEFLKGATIKAFILALIYFFVLFSLIFWIKIPIFYKFYSYQTLTFWFFWKLLGCFFVVERLYNKYSFLNFDVHSIHNNEQQWEQELKELNDENKLFFKNTPFEETLKPKIDDFYDRLKVSIFNHMKKIQKWKQKLNWQDYLNYFLGLNLLGAIGYFFLMIDASLLESTKKVFETPSAYYFIGIVFCYTEIVIYDLTHGIFLFSCVFLEQINANKAYYYDIINRESMARNVPEQNNFDISLKK